MLEKIKTHYQILEKIKKQSLLKLWKLRHDGKETSLVRFLQEQIGCISIIGYKVKCGISKLLRYIDSTIAIASSFKASLV